MNYSAKVIGIVITPAATTATVQGLQDQAQQAKDENECYNIAKQQSGVDPAAASTQQAQDAKGAGAKGAAKGAAAGCDCR
jgi:hypothetical protein